MKKQISNLGQVAYVRRYTISGGQEDGVKVIELYNGVLRVLLNESKALDIMQIFYKGVNTSFVSKNGFSTKEGDFAKRFEGGALYTVGLDSAGGREGFEVHGSFHNLKPLVKVAEVVGDSIVVEGEIKDSALFGKNLVMKRRYTLKLDSDALVLEDELVNLGTEKEPYCVLYHNNIGYPLLDEGSELTINNNKYEPRTPYAKEKMAEGFVITEPLDNQEETCYFIESKDGVASITNKKLGVKFSIEFSKDTLPYMVEWKSMRSGDYALGLEPTTTLLDDRFQYSYLEVGKSVSFKLVYKAENL